MRPNRMKHKLAAGEMVLGPNLQIDHPWLVEMIGLAGFDFVMLDAEHGLALNNLPALIGAADAADIPAIVRVPDHSRAYLNWALEAGAGGVQVPMVDTPDQAAALVRETKFAPVGARGFSNATRAADFGRIDALDYAEIANREVLLCVQLETKTSLENAQEIAQVAGVDMVFIGPADLAQSLGYPGQSKAPPVIDAIVRVVNTLHNHMPVGISAFSAEDVRFWKAHGVRSILTSSMHPIRQAFEQLHSDLKSGLQ